jgi:uncharacterized protein (TIGR02646 family)
MIKLVKGPEPAVLARHATEWTAELIQVMGAGGDIDAVKSSRYGHKEVKEALLEETNEKCAYCESKPLHVTFGDVEHICPKGVDPLRAYDWQNLTLACSVCNNKKRAKVDIVDPYLDEPDVAFEFYGPWLTEIAATPNAKRTRIELDLNRKELLSQRGEQLAKIRSELVENRANPDANERRLTEEAIIAHYESSFSQFSACARHFLRDFVARNPLTP